MHTTLSDSTAQRLDLALAVLRIVVGIVFVAHGAQKLFVFGVGGTIGAFAQMGVPLPSLTAPLVIALEFLGGLALIAGVLTRVVALLFVFDMVGAIVFVHLAAGFFLPNGYEFAFTLLGGSAALALAGAGAYSLDHLLARRRTRPAMATTV